MTSRPGADIGGGLVRVSDRGAPMMLPANPLGAGRCGRGGRMRQKLGAGRGFASIHLPADADARRMPAVTAAGDGARGSPVLVDPPRTEAGRRAAPIRGGAGAGARTGSTGMEEGEENLGCWKSGTGCSRRRLVETITPAFKRMLGDRMRPRRRERMAQEMRLGAARYDRRQEAGAAGGMVRP